MPFSLQGWPLTGGVPGKKPQIGSSDLVLVGYVDSLRNVCVPVLTDRANTRRDADGMVHIFDASGGMGWVMTVNLFVPRSNTRFLCSGAGAGVHAVRHRCMPPCRCGTALRPKRPRCTPVCEGPGAGGVVPVGRGGRV